MRILIANIRLAKRTGTEIVTRDFAHGLARRGHEVVVWSPRLGPFADSLRTEGLNVVADLSAAAFAPEIAHINHAGLVAPVFGAFPRANGLFHCHTPGEAVDAAVRHPRVRGLYGVSPLACRRIEEAAGRPADGVLRNFVDLARFVPQGRLPPRPKRWLLVAEQKHGLRHAARVAWLSVRSGAHLAAVGPSVGRVIDNLPAEAARHDLVFASGRCAIESAAAGAGVIVTDCRGVAGFLRPENAPCLLEGNFGGETFSRNAAFAELAAAVAAWDPSSAERAAAFVRRQADLDRGLDQLEALYSRICA